MSSSALGTTQVLLLIVSLAMGSAVLDSTDANVNRQPTEAGVNQTMVNNRLAAPMPSLWSYITSIVRTSFALTEGRGNKGGKGGGHGTAMMMGAMMLMMGLSGLAALSGKALAASMAALMLAAMSLMKKGHGGHSTYEVVTVPHSGHHHRSLAEGEAEYPSGYGYEMSADTLSPTTSHLQNHKISKK